MKRIFIFILVCLSYFSAFSQIMFDNVQLHRPVNFITGTTPFDNDAYIWGAIDDGPQAINLNVIKTEVTTFHIQENNIQLAFNRIGAAHYFIKFQVCYDCPADDIDWITLHEGGSTPAVDWTTPPASFSTIGSHNLKVRYWVSGANNAFFREYNVEAVPAAQEFHRDNFKTTTPFTTGNTLTCWDGGNPNGKVAIVSEGFDAPNAIYPESYRFRGNELANELFELGYKVYIVNYSLGNQSLRNNATVLHSAIEYVSSINGDQDVLVMGLSMGGVIARFTLARAEEQGDNLPVSMFASFDAPQQGAVVDADFQDFVAGEGDFHALDNNAAKQMLIYNTYDPAGLDHTNFYNELDAFNGIGYPTAIPTIGIAFSNGNPNPDDGLDWLNINGELLGGNVLNETFDIENEWGESGSWLPRSGTDVDPISALGGWITVTTTRFKNPTFITHNSALDIVDGHSKFCIPITTESTDPPFFHDEVPSSIVDPFIQTVRQKDLSEIVENEVYNFTEESGPWIMNDLTIRGEMHVNKSGNSGSSLDPLPPAPTANFTAITSNCASNIFVEDGAKVLLGEHGSQLGNLEIKNESQMFVKEGGLVDVKRGSILKVKRDATLKIESGGILRVSDNSQLVIENGGKLIIEPGATIQLWDGQEPDGDAKILIAGTLEINGEFDFSGNGYFHFVSTKTLVLNDPDFGFQLEGIDKGYRMIKLGSGTTLSTEGFPLRLASGKVEYGENSKIKVLDGGRASLIDMEMQATSQSSGIGLQARNLNRLIVKNSSFVDLEEGIQMSEMNETDLLYILNSEFSNCVFGISADNCSSYINISGTRFIAEENSGIFGFGGFGCKDVLFSSSQIEGFNTQGAIGAFLQDVRSFLVSGSRISNNDTGINSPFDSKSNVFLLNQSVIENNNIGVHIEKGGFDDFGIDYGLIHMNCAKLLNNDIGIMGEDVLLQIDAYQNSNTGDSEIVRANHFQNPSNGLLFSICYVDRFDIFNVSATGNYWGTNNNNPNQVDYSLKNSTDSPCNTFSLSNVDLDTSLPAETEPIGCGSGNGNSGDEKELADEHKCTIIVNEEERKIHTQYSFAYEKFLEEENLESSPENARLLFSPVAAISDDVRATSNSACRQYIDVARTFVDFTDMLGLGGGRITGDIDLSQFTANYWVESSLHSTQKEKEKILVYPNPTNNDLYLKTGENLFVRYKIVDVMGRYWLEGEIENDVEENKIDISMLNAGIYMLHLESETSRWEIIRFVVSE